ncbi:MAG: hypothetical protein HKN12_08175, partial [Gemmatimonadetes bacterium]|nr:hypothetical protein [Gemmatimonadota bacterium]
MRSLGFLSLFAGLAALLIPVASAHAEDGFRVLRSDATVLEVEVTTGPTVWDQVPGESGRTFRRPRLTGGLFLAQPGEPDVPALVRMIGIPPEGTPRLRVVSVTPVAERAVDLAPGGEPVVKRAPDVAPWGSEKRTELAATSGTLPGAWAEIDGTFWMRHQRMARIRLNPYRYDADTGELLRAERLIVRVEFGEAGLTRNAPRPDHRSWENSIGRELLNADVAKSWRRPVSRARGGGESFASSPNWLRIPIDRTGIYRVDYFSFSNAGIDPAGIDPRTVRVFAGTNQPLEERYDVEPPSFMTECALLPLDDSPVSDGIFDVDDRFLLFAHGVDGWASEFDPALPRTEWIENPYTEQTFYWVTWGGSFADPPKRMTQRPVPPSGSPTVATMPWR